MQKTNRLHFDLAELGRFETFHDDVTGSAASFLQMSPGWQELKADTIDLGAVRLLRVSSHGQHLWRDIKADKRLHLGLLLACPGGIQFQGRPIAWGNVYLWQANAENEFLTHGHYDVLEIILDEATAARFFPMAVGDPVRTAPRDLLDDLRRVCLNVLEAGKNVHPHSSNTPNIDLRAPKLQDGLLEALQNLFDVWDRQGETPAVNARKFRVVGAVRDILGQSPEAQSLHADDIARIVGVSRRTLFAAFQQVYGVGPHRFNELQRLNHLRSHLHAHTPTTGSVTHLANEFGFSELGRLSSRYRSLFGELPSQTLRRLG